MAAAISALLYVSAAFAWGSIAIDVLPFIWKTGRKWQAAYVAVAMFGSITDLLIAALKGKLFWSFGG